MKSAWSLVILIFLILTLLAACSGGNSTPIPVSTPKWRWVSGSNTLNQAGNYGVQGTAASSNLPGARASDASWIDAQGKLWLFGGFGSDAVGNSGFLNDLWKHDPVTLEWTWVSGSNTGSQVGFYGMKGIADSSNVPGGRYSAISWIDSQGRLWLFGGYGLDWAGNLDDLNDLWKYDPTTQEWTWVSGSNTVNQTGTYGTLGVADPANVPGARQAGVTWFDSSGNLWLFGGTGYDSAGNRTWLNDLWKFDLATLEWTWVSGSSAGHQAGIYGIKGTADPANVPGARETAVSWIDPQGNLWLFGGFGYDSARIDGILNDLWKYNPTILEWTWVSGSSTVNRAGIYGTKGTAAPSNVPGARDHAVSWMDSSGKLWLFGGFGYDSARIDGILNDLWKYDPTILEWTWVSGGSSVNQAGIYRTKGTADSLSVPGAREKAVSWIDSQGKLWVFGGYGYASGGNQGYLNDLWQCTR